MSDIKSIVTAESYEAVRRLLRETFPSAKIGDSSVDAFIGSLWHKHPATYAALDLAPLPEEVAARFAGRSDAADSGSHRLYTVSTLHARTHTMATYAPMKAAFTQLLPCVRVTLPDALSEQNQVVRTDIGDVDLAKDHLLGSVGHIFERYTAQLEGRRPARVDLITTARSRESQKRFAPVTFYLIYREAGDRAPSAFVFEGGRSDGEAKNVYFGPRLGRELWTPEYESGFRPTPFAHEKNLYRGWLAMRADDADEPMELSITARQPNQTKPYLAVHATFAPGLAVNPDPAEYQLEATARVAFLGEVMGSPVEEDVNHEFAKLGRENYLWDITPSVDGGTQ